MIATRVTNYSALVLSIAALPPVSNGLCRVYRGQTTDYPKILSSFARVRGGPAAEVSRVFFQHLFVKQATLSIIGDFKKLGRFNYFDLNVAPENFYLAEALVQHYGYQSRYVDATPSLDVALWFSRHCFRGHADEPAGDKAPFRMTFPAWYEPSSEEGVLYVIDVNEWDQKSAISPGDYVDLIPIAPDGVNRPRRQTGGVLFAPGLGEGYDDISSFVRAKFTIAFPWSESGKDWDADYLFPNPRSDAIYSRLLAAPFFRTIKQESDGKEETVWRRSFTIPEYYADPRDGSRHSLYRSFDIALKPTLYYPWLRRNLDHLQTDPAWQATFAQQFAQAVPILLERPHILFSMQRGGPQGAPDQAPAEIGANFRNFFLEYSPESFSVAYDENKMARGVCCCWLNSHEFFLQSFGTLNQQPRGSEISRYEWQPGLGLVCTGGPDLGGSFVTLPLDLIQLTAEGALTLRPPDAQSSGYFTLTTNEKFWSRLGGWTDLL